MNDVWPALKELQDFLSAVPNGPIADTTELVPLLAACWHRLEGGDTGRMEEYKLHRMEDATWGSPVLQYTIERHGGTVLGSTRAELHIWSVNIDAKTASCCVVGHRQLTPMQPRLDVRPLAEEIARKIIAGEDDPRLKRLDGGKVRVSIGKVLPKDSGFKQTVEGRRRRFLAALQDRLAVDGWRECGWNAYERQSAITLNVCTNERS